jgi:hypothetical protein
MILAVLNSQERARKQRKALQNKQAVNATSRVKASGAMRDQDTAQDSSQQVVFAKSKSKSNLLTSKFVSFPEFISQEPKHTKFETNEERWYFLAVNLLQRHQEGNRSVNNFHQSIVPFFKDVQFNSGVALSSQEKNRIYHAFIKRVSATGTIQSSDAEEVLSSHDFDFDVTEQEVAIILNEKLLSRNGKLDPNQQWTDIDCENDMLDFGLFLSLACDLKQRKQLLIEKDSKFILSNLFRCMPLDPESTSKQCWDFFCMLLLLYCSFSVPYGIAFSENTSDGPMSAMDGFALAIDVIFMIDISLTFVTAVDIEGFYVRDLRTIASHYTRTWFAADFAGSFPFDNVIALAVESQGSVSSTNFIRILRFVRMLKLIRAVRLIGRLNKLKHRDGLEVLAPIIGISTSIFILVFTAHLLGCFFTMLLASETDDVNWLTHYNPELSDAGDQTRYVVALYWAMISVTTMGYGDVIPVTHTERIFGLVVALVGAVVFSFCMGNVASLISQVPSLFLKPAFAALHCCCGVPCFRTIAVPRL